MRTAHLFCIHVLDLACRLMNAVLTALSRNQTKSCLYTVFIRHKVMNI